MGDTGTFKTFVVTGSTGIYDDGQGNSLNNYAGFLYMIMGQGSAKDSSGSYTNGFSGCVKAGYIDFAYPYNFNYSTGININIGGTTSLSYQYTNDPSSQKYIGSNGTYPNFQPYDMGQSPSGNTWPGAEYDGMNTFCNTPQPIVINADQSSVAYTISPGSDPQQSNNPINTNYYVSGWSAGSGQTYTVSDQRNNNYTGNTGGIYRGNVLGGTSVTYSAGGYYGQIIGDTGAPGPFGYGAGANLNPTVGPTNGYGVITLIPKTSLQYVNFVGNPGGNAGWSDDWQDGSSNNIVISWHGIGSTGSGVCQTKSNYLVYMAGGGGAGGYGYSSNSYGGCGGGAGFWGFSIFNSDLYTNYTINAGNGGAGVNGQNNNPLTGNPGESSSLILSGTTDASLTINCLGGEAGSAGDGSTIGGIGGNGYFGGGAGNSYSGDSLNVITSSGGYGYLNIPSYSGSSNSTSSQGGAGSGSIYTSFFGKSVSTTTSDNNVSGGGGGGFWAGYGSAHDNVDLGNTDLYLSSAGGYASGGGGGGNASNSTNTNNHASGGGSSGFVALYQLIGNTHKFMILNKTQTISYQNLYQYKGFWAFTENFDTSGNSKNQFINNTFNQIHFLISKDGVQSIQYNSTGNALTINFRPLSIDLGQGSTTVPQSFLFTGGKLITASTNYTQSNYWKILFYY